MHKPGTSLAVLGLALMVFAQQADSADWKVGLESGIVLNGYNDIQIPNVTGTRFSLTGDLSTDAEPFLRLTAECGFGSRHTVGVLFAPLSLRAEGRIDGEVFFDTIRFPAGSDFHALYKFNSYRMTYRYTVHHGKRFAIGAGLTGKIRDAAVVLESDGLRAEYANVGFVPLINFRLEYLPAGRIGAVLEGDALAAPQGRAEDVAVMLNYQVSRSLKLMAGYRVLEGGADVDDVYSFALLHYIAVGARFTI